MLNSYITMKTLIIWIKLTVLYNTVVGKRYSGYHKYRLGPVETEDQLETLENIRVTDLRTRKVQVLHDAVRPGEDCSVIAAPDWIDHLISTLNRAGIPYQLISNDVQRSHDEVLDKNSAQSKQWYRAAGWATQARGKRAPAASSPPLFYMQYQQQVEYVKGLAEASDIAQYSSIGDSFEGRELPLITINGDRRELPGIWMDAGMHSREWITHATALHILHTILLDSGDKAAYLRQNYRIYIAPNLNPDGYLYTWTDDRYWRKNRNVTSGCGGVDLNRNFNVTYGGCHTSGDPCSNTFRGSGPASEPETQAIVRRIQQLHGHMGGIQLFLSMHAAAQAWLIPWASDSSKPRDYDDLLGAGQEAVRALQQVDGVRMSLGTPPDILYCAAGALMDWAKNDGTLPGDGAGIKYSYTPELRGNHEFVIDPDNIDPSGREMFAALYAAVSRIRSDASIQRTTVFKYATDDPRGGVTVTVNSNETRADGHVNGAGSLESKCFISFLFGCIISLLLLPPVL